jgi:hypothetical protein
VSKFQFQNFKIKKIFEFELEFEFEFKHWKNFSKIFFKFSATKFFYWPLSQDIFGAPYTRTLVVNGNIVCLFVCLHASRIGFVINFIYNTPHRIHDTHNNAFDSVMLYYKCPPTSWSFHRFTKNNDGNLC